MFCVCIVSTCTVNVARAQRRLNGVDLFGYQLTAVLEQPQQPQPRPQQPRPQPMSWKVNDHPLLLPPSSQQQQLLQPHPFQQRPPLPHPSIPSNYNLSASFPPSSTQFSNSFNNVPPSSKTGQPIMAQGVPAEFYLPKPPPHASKPLMHTPPIPPGAYTSQPLLPSPPAHRDHEIIIVAGKGRIVIDGIKAVLEKTLVPIAANKLTGEIVKFCLMASVMVSICHGECMSW